ncbi:MAG TPA: hypothetical protein VFB62_00160 [Polyangiaceae bacterium]|nr:hypothetical protein [Polyangiaceae bacterium]
MNRRACLLVGCALSVACSEVQTSATPSGTGAGGGTTAATSSAATGSGGGLTGEWVTLIEGNWELPPLDEDYWCATTTVTEDMYVRAFRALAPIGTHHTVVSKSNGGEPDGEFPCGASTLADEMIFASGVGTNDLIFPPGVAMEIKAGTQILLNLHLFNTSSSPINGLSGALVQTIPLEEVQQRAEVIFAGSVAIIIPPMSAGDTDGWCEFPADATVMTVWPHMHQYGTKMKVIHESGAGDVTLHEGPFSFTEQLNYEIDPVVVHGGERVHVYCEYQNTSNATVTFGDSSTQEMCFAGLYRYPALNDGLFCDLPLN